MKSLESSGSGLSSATEPAAWWHLFVDPNYGPRVTAAFREQKTVTRRNAPKVSQPDLRLFTVFAVKSELRALLLSKGVTAENYLLEQVEGI